MAERIFPEPGERVLYTLLTREQQHALHAWLRDHGVQHCRVPLYASFDFDAATGEWRIPVYWYDADGRMCVHLDGETVRKHVVRRRELRPLPWPTWPDGDCDDPDCFCWDDQDDDAGHGDDWPPIETVQSTGGLL